MADIEKSPRKKPTRNPKRKRRAFDDIDETEIIIGPGADPKSDI